MLETSNDIICKTACQYRLHRGSERLKQKNRSAVVAIVTGHLAVATAAVGVVGGATCSTEVADASWGSSYRIGSKDV